MIAGPSKHPVVNFVRALEPRACYLIAAAKRGS